MVAKITQQEETLYQALNPVVKSLGVELIDVDVRSHQGELLVKIIIDSDDGVGVDDCGRISEQVAPVIEVEDPELFQEARIEVSSPGVERRLRRPEEFEQFRGRNVTVKCYAPYQEKKEWTGDLNSLKDEEIKLDLDGGKNILIPLNQVASVRLNFDAESFLSSGGNNANG